MLYRLEEKTGLPCNAHTFRRTFASLLAKRGIDSLHIMRLGRWESLAMVEQPNLMAVPVVVLQAWADCMVRKAFNQGEGEYGKASDEFMDEVKKSSEQFGNEIDKAIEHYKDAVEKAIKEFEDEASRYVGMAK